MLPKRGRVLPIDGGDNELPEGYAVMIAHALRSELGASHQAIKTVMKWTGASERTAKNWFHGSSGPSGEHLISLAQNSDAVFEVFLRLASRRESLASKKLVEARNAIAEVLELVVSLTV